MQTRFSQGGAQRGDGCKARPLRSWYRRDDPRVDPQFFSAGIAFASAFITVASIPHVIKRSCRSFPGRPLAAARQIVAAADDHANLYAKVP